MKVDLDSSDLLTIKYALRRDLRLEIKFDKEHPDRDSRNWLDVRKIHADLYSRIFHAHKNYWHKSGS